MQFPGRESYSKLRVRALAAMEAMRTHHNGETWRLARTAGVRRTMSADCLSIPDKAIFRIDQSYGAISMIDWIDSVPLVGLLNAQPTMVAAKRRGFLPVFGGAQPLARVSL